MSFLIFFSAILPFQGNPTQIETNQLQGSQLVPSSYSGYAWLSLLFCCFPLAVAAIYKSDKVCILSLNAFEWTLNID